MVFFFRGNDQVACLKTLIFTSLLSLSFRQFLGANDRGALTKGCLDRPKERPGKRISEVGSVKWMSTWGPRDLEKALRMAQEST